MGERMTLRAKTLIVFVLMLVLLSVHQLLTDLQVIALPILLVFQLLGLFRAFIMLRRWHTRSKLTHLAQNLCCDILGCH
jgi:positive regulator of sigma E activity